MSVSKQHGFFDQTKSEGVKAAQRTENNHKWTSDLRGCYKSRGGATEKVLGNPLVIAQAFPHSVPRFKSHWKVRNKTAFSTAMMVSPVAKLRVIFVIPVQDTASMYLHYHRQDLRLRYVHLSPNLEHLLLFSTQNISICNSGLFCTTLMYLLPLLKLCWAALPSPPPSPWRWEVAQTVEAAKEDEQPHTSDAMSLGQALSVILRKILFHN